MLIVLENILIDIETAATNIDIYTAGGVFIASVMGAATSRYQRGQGVCVVNPIVVNSGSRRNLPTAGVNPSAVAGVKHRIEKIVVTNILVDYVRDEDCLATDVLNRIVLYCIGVTIEIDT